jgi:hypothetical protein
VVDSEPAADAHRRVRSTGLVSELVVIGTASYKASIGYADVYDLQVRDVLAGAFAAPSITVTILAGDKERSSFLADHPAPVEVEIEFAAVGENEPYATAPVSGFVDEQRRSWEIRSMRVPDEENR